MSTYTTISNKENVLPESGEISEKLGEVELLFTKIESIKNSPEGKKIFAAIRKERWAIGDIFREYPEVRNIYRFKKLMESIDNGQHFGHYGRAISRAKWIGRLREATTEEMEIIVSCFRNKTKLPFLTVGFRRIWYVAKNPENKASQAMLFALRDLYHRAKDAAEGGKTSLETNR